MTMKQKFLKSVGKAIMWIWTTLL